MFITNKMSFAPIFHQFDITTTISTHHNVIQNFFLRQQIYTNWSKLILEKLKHNGTLKHITIEYLVHNCDGNEFYINEKNVI